MATKTPASKSSSRGKQRGAIQSSRKTVRKTSAPYAMRADDDDDEGAGNKSASPAGAAAPPQAGAPADTRPPAGQPDEQAGAAHSHAGATVTQGEVKADATPASSENASPETTREADAVSAENAAPETVQEIETRTPASTATVTEQEAEPSGPQESEYAVLLAPTDIGDWDPERPAPPPGKAPPGDSRSFRRVREGTEEFVLIYRYGSNLMTRAGRVGTQGMWTVVEYPHIGAAAHAYAQECSNLVAAGYRDLR